MPQLKNKRHEAFCLEYHKNGFNGFQAYKKVYGGSDKSCEANSARLIRSDKVQNRLDELGKKAKLRYGIDMESIVNDLNELRERGKLNDPNTALKSLDMLIKIAGEYAPTKTDNQHKFSNLDELDGLQINLK